MMMIRAIPVLLCCMTATTVDAQYLADNLPEKTATTTYEAAERAYRAGDHTTAIALFSLVLEQDPEHLNAYLQRGFCHNLSGSYEQAVTDFSAVIERKDDHSWAYTSRGSAYNKLGKYELAIADFNKVIALDPKNEEAFNNRGWARKAAGDPAAACKDWQTSKKLGNAEAKIILTNNRCK